MSAESSRFHPPRARPRGRGAEPSPIVPDPGITWGRLRILQRTDGKWIVYDPEQPIARRTLAIRTSAKLALEYAKEVAQ